MKQAETLKIMALIVAAHPASKLDPEDDNQVAVWHDMLKDLPYDTALLATQSMLATLKFPPSIADIREAVARSVSEARGDLTAGEAWDRVLRAVHRYGWNRPDEAKTALGEPLWDAIGMVGGWAHLCESDEIEIISAQFERRYKARQDQQQRQLQIPAQVRDHLMALGAGQMVKRIGGAT